MNRWRFVMTLIKFGLQDLFILLYIKPSKLGTLFQMIYQILILLSFRTPTCRFSMLLHGDVRIYCACVLEESVAILKKKKRKNAVITMDSLTQNIILWILFQVVLRLQFYRLFPNSDLECKRLESQDNVLFIILLQVPRITFSNKYLDKPKWPSCYRYNYFRQE